MNNIEKYIEYRNKKERIKKIRTRIILTSISILGVLILLFNLPLFDIKKVSFKNVNRTNYQDLKKIKNELIGNNIFIYNKKEVKKSLNNIKYIKDFDIKIKGINKLEIVINEEIPAFYITEGKDNYIINNNFEILENAKNIEGFNLVQINCKDIKKEDKNQYIEELNKFYPYIVENRTDLKFDSIDLTDLFSVKAHMGEVLIKFGKTDNLHEKIETVYRIMLSENINLKKGYIDLSFDSTPVVKIENKEEIEETTDEHIDNNNEFTENTEENIDEYIDEIMDNNNEFTENIEENIDEDIDEIMNENIYEEIDESINENIEEDVNEE